MPSSDLIIKPLVTILTLIMMTAVFIRAVFDLKCPCPAPKDTPRRDFPTSGIFQTSRLVITSLLSIFICGYIIIVWRMGFTNILKLQMIWMPRSSQDLINLYAHKSPFTIPWPEGVISFYPFLVSLAGHCLGGHYALAVLAISIPSWIAFYYFCNKLVAQHFGNDIARETLLFLAVLPFNFLIFLPGPLPLILPCAMISFVYAMEKKRVRALLFALITILWAPQFLLHILSAAIALFLHPSSAKALITSLIFPVSCQRQEWLIALFPLALAFAVGSRGRQNIALALRFILSLISGLTLFIFMNTRPI